MFSKPEREIWETRRPLTAIVENHIDARPLSGLSRADVVYEAVAEGGITRFLAVFYCGAAAQDFDVAVIRSARVYYINWASEYGDKPLFLHWGGANNIDNNSPSGKKAYGQVAPEVDSFSLLSKIGWRNGLSGNDLDGQTNFAYPALVRDYYRLSSSEKALDEHSPLAHVDEVYKQASEVRGYGYKDSEGNAWDENFVEWQFAEDAPVSDPKTSSIAFEFGSRKDYDVEWKYEKDTNSYLRLNGGKPFTDHFFEGKQISAKNVVIQFVKEKGPVDREDHMFYGVIGDGKGLIFQNGDVVEVTWEKESQFDRTRFYTSTGKEASFVGGEIWIEAVPAGNDVSY
jgi:hypothetical protein